MTYNWDKFNAEVIKIKNNIINEAKRAIKKNVPKNELVRQEIRDNLLKLYNNFTRILATNWTNLDEQQRYATKQIFLHVRDKVVRAYQALNVKYKIPISITGLIDINILDDDTETEEDESDNMALGKVDFLNFASKLIPSQFDGSFTKLQSFIDSLTLLEINSVGNEDNALAFVKTRLTGKARTLISDNMTILDVINALKTGIKGESSKALSAKLLNTKQNCKDSIKFSNEIEDLASSLKLAFISEGVPSTVAETYTTDLTVKSLAKNSTSEKTKIIMEAGNFSSIQEAISKFVSVESEPNGNVFVLKNSQSYNNKRFNNNYIRGRGRYGNNNSNFSNHQYQRGGYRNNNYRNQFQNNRQNQRQNTRNVRLCGTQDEASQENQGNQSPPQRERLGDM